MCPLCGRHPASVPLIGAWVCEACRNRFALRRWVAFGLDVIAWTIITLVPSALPRGLVSSGFLLGWFGLWPVLFLFRDGLGGSPGKWLMGLRVVDEATHRPAGPWASLRRNLILLVPGVNLVVALLVLNGTRVGDGWARTLVVWHRYADCYPFTATRGCLCAECGYDLTGNCSGRCPECGHDIPSDVRRTLRSGVPAAG